MRSEGWSRRRTTCPARLACCEPDAPYEADALRCAEAEPAPSTPYVVEAEPALCALCVAEVRPTQRAPSATGWT
eukprot:731061-Alexandrium_andersonii.AAC.1